MLPYFLLFSFFAIGALITGHRQLIDRNNTKAVFFAGMLGLIIMIGLRYRVGGDWLTYIHIYQNWGGKSFSVLVGHVDPAYLLLNGLAFRWQTGIWFVNLSCAVVFGWGLSRFCQIQPNPWLAVVVAIPYLVIVVAMGYTRQAAALGIIMCALADYSRKNSLVRFAIYITFAGLFHSTAVVTIIFLLLTGKQNRYLKSLIAFVIAALFFQYFLKGSVDNLMRNYVEARYSSQGAAIRVSITAVSAVIFLAGSRKFGFVEEERLIWRNFAFVSLMAVAALYFTPSSTAVDRISLYLIPLQIAVFARVPYMTRERQGTLAVVIAYSAALMTGWLTFAVHARYWVPYQMTFFT